MILSPTYFHRLVITGINSELASNMLLLLDVIFTLWRSMSRHPKSHVGQLLLICALSRIYALPLTSEFWICNASSSIQITHSHSAKSESSHPNSMVSAVSYG